LGTVLGFGFTCTFHWGFFGSGAVTAWIFSYDLEYLDSDPWGGHRSNIHFSHEKTVAEISGLIRFFYEPIPS